MRDEDLVSAIETIDRASVDPGGWSSVLQHFIDAAGGAGAQLVGSSPESGLLINYGLGLSPTVFEEFEARAAWDHRVNPRISALGRTRPLTSVAECDFISVEHRDRHPLYQDYFAPNEASFSCMANLIDEPDLTVGIAVLRSERQGHVGQQERRRFEILLPYLRRAVRSQLAMETRAIALGAEAMAALGLAVMVCDRQGRVIATTPAAEDILLQADPVTVRRARLVATDIAQDHSLQAVLNKRHHTLGATMDLSRSIVLRTRRGAPLRVDIVPVPPAPAFGVGAAYVVFRTPPGPVSIETLTGLGLTPSEAATARLIAKGLAPQDVAETRGVTEATVRTQIAGAFAKLGVNRQSELVAYIRDLI